MARDPERAARWWAFLAEHNLGALGRSIRSGVASGRIEAEAEANLLRSFEPGQGPSTPTSGCGWRATPPRWPPGARPPRAPDAGHGPGGLAGLVG